MATLTRQNVASEGSEATWAAADAAGDEVAYARGQYLLVWNDGGAAERTITVVSQHTPGVGTAKEDSIRTVAVDAIAIIPIGSPVYEDADGMVQFSADDETSVKYAVIKP